jgi:3-hydroxy-9,10-secoandrosta-1,3,5(10)-triene-9,17-dione monooxygenase
MFDTDNAEKTVEIYSPKGDDFLSPAELKALTSQKVIDACRALTQPLREHASQAEKQRRPVDHLWDKIRASGYFYMLIPKKWGGLESSIDEVCDATMALARGCGSTGWVASFGMMHNRHLTGNPIEFQEEVFGGGKYTIYAGASMPFGKAVPAPGGWKVSGRFKWATCVTQSDWVQAVCAFESADGGAPTFGSVMIPTGKGRVIDTWNTDGMRGTGTHDFEVKDVFVPEHHTNRAPPSRDGKGLGSKLYDNPIFAVPLSPLLTFTTLMVVVGMAQSAVELYKERLESHTKRGTDARQADKQASQIRLAKADIMVATAEMLCREAMKENLVGTDLVGDAQVPFRCKVKAKMGMSAQLCKDAVLLICEATGTSIHYLDNPLQRIMRDMMVATSHIVFDYDVVFEQHGRAMLGLPPTSQFV